MLICTDLAALAGYLFPIEMAQKLLQLFKWGCLDRGDSGQPPPHLRALPQLLLGWREPRGLEGRRGLWGWLAPGGRRIKQKVQITQPRD